MSSSKCAKCEQTVYPVEGLRCLDKLWHKGCFKCHECSMTLNMKNYKGFEKRPYCNAHCPQAKATTVADTPESRRLAENTRIQSQAKYHEDFEKSKRKGFTAIADDPETLRIKNTSKIISNVAYHGELERKKQMEEKRGLSGSDDGSSTSPSTNNNNSVTTNQNNKQISSNIKQISGGPPQAQVQQHHQQHYQEASNYLTQTQQTNKQLQQIQQQQLLQQQQQQQQLQKQQQHIKQQQLLKQQQVIYAQDHHHHHNNGHQISKQHHLVDGLMPPMLATPQARHIIQQQQQQQYPPAVIANQQQQQQQQQILMRQHQLMMQQQQQQQRQSLELTRSQHQLPRQNSGPSNQHSQQQQHLIKHQQLVSVGQQQPQPLKYVPMPEGNLSQHHHQSSPTHMIPAHMIAPQASQPNGLQRVPPVAMNKTHQQHLVHGYHHQVIGQPAINGVAVPKQQQQHFIGAAQPPQARHLIQQHPPNHQIQHLHPQMRHLQYQQQQAPPVTSSRVFRAMYDYEANDVDEVSFFENDVLIDCVDAGGNWLVGKVARTGQGGMFPANYVTEYSSQ